jgi:ATP-dependent Clp endopeptidase proteolytic subunit ClpP
MKKQQWFNLQAQGNHLDIYLYGVIGGWDVDVNTFLDQVKSVPNPETVTVWLNTVGGSFYDGLPIFNTLAQMEAVVTVNVMGYALSMGSVLMLAGDKTRMAQNGLIMIHRANTWADGDAVALRKEADILEKHEAGIIKLYAERLGKTDAEILALLQEETWFTADEALAAGLIDEIIDPIDTTKAVAEAFAGNESVKVVSNYHNMPTELSAVLTKKTAKSNFLKTLLGLTDKTKPAATTTPDEADDNMTDDDLKKVADMVKAAVDPIATTLATTQEALQAAQEKNTALDASVTSLSAELAELKLPDTPTPTPENDGAAGELTYDY